MQDQPTAPWPAQEPPAGPRRFSLAQLGQRRTRLIALITLPLVFIMLLGLMLVAHPKAHAASAFVTHQGTQFFVNGAPFQVVGSNNYYPIIEPQVMVDDLFANAETAGFNTMRIWAFADIGSLDGTVPSI